MRQSQLRVHRIPASGNGKNPVNQCPWLIGSVIAVTRRPGRNSVLIVVNLGLNGL